MAVGVYQRARRRNKNGGARVRHTSGHRSQASPSTSYTSSAPLPSSSSSVSRPLGKSALAPKSVLFQFRRNRPAFFYAMVLSASAALLLALCLAAVLLPHSSHAYVGQPYSDYVERAARADAGAPRVRLAGAGTVVGTTTSVSGAPTPVVNQFLGIPFAASPPLRFAPPDDPLPYLGGVLNATQYRSSCIQQFNSNSSRLLFNTPAPPESEDCLYLNIFTPSTNPSPGGRPVMFWVYGGNLQFGTGQAEVYDGSSFAANQDVVIVTFNYRTNVFGFPADPSMPVTKRNVGFFDQRKALAWVSQNIGAFGGDPSKVTIFGESAGGYSVKQLFALPPKPLSFRAAILQSQGQSNVGTGEEAWAALAEDLGCNATSSSPSLADAATLACLRAQPADAIRTVLQNRALSFPPAVDNATNMQHVERAIFNRTAAPVPLLVGTNANEGTIFAGAVPTSQLLLQTIFGSRTDLQDAARAAYPANISDTELKADIITDASFTCLTSTLAVTAASNGFKTWRYYFNASFPNFQPFPGAGVWHSSEINEVFGTYVRDDRTTDQQVQLSQFMQTAWADFAKDPSGAGPGWAVVDGARAAEGEDLGTRVDYEALGSNGSSAGQTVRRGQVDERCGVYRLAIEVVGL